MFFVKDWEVRIDALPASFWGDINCNCPEALILNPSISPSHGLSGATSTLEKGSFDCGNRWEDSKSAPINKIGFIVKKCFVINN
jgi:hypothetical protein